jgi:hypothetical protein
LAAGSEEELASASQMPEALVRWIGGDERAGLMIARVSDFCRLCLMWLPAGQELAGA